MDPEQRSSPRTVKFSPKGPPRRPLQSATTESQIPEDDGPEDEAEQQALLRRVHDMANRGPKVEKKSPVQVVFSHVSPSTTIRTFGKQKERSSEETDSVHVEEVILDEENISLSTQLVDETEVDNTSTDSTDAVIVKEKRKYEEPWDYKGSYYPVSLPLRKPYSGDPELLNEEEFEKEVEYDEDTLCSAKELGLLEEDEKPRMLLFKMPEVLPIAGKYTGVNRSEADDNLRISEKGISDRQEKGKGILESSVNPEMANESDSRKKSDLDELPAGFMGKMLVHKSGAVKLKLGDILFDVSPGSECICPQDLVCINTKEGHCCELGRLSKRAIVSPEVDSLLDNLK